MASIFDIKDDGEFRVVGIEEEKNRGIITETFRKHCLNSYCSLFGLPTSEGITDRVIKLNPEFRIKERNVFVTVGRFVGISMDIIEYEELHKQCIVNSSTIRIASAFGVSTHAEVRGQVILTK